MEAALDLSMFKWQGLSTFPTSTSYQERAKDLLETINWNVLSEYASSLRDGKKCRFEKVVAQGGRHLVRILTFEDNLCWITRLGLPKAVPNGKAERLKSDLGADLLMDREVACLMIVCERTSTPVPKVHGCVATTQTSVGAAVIFMECLKGNVALDICFDSIPPQLKPKFFSQMARAQVSTPLL